MARGAQRAGKQPLRHILMAFFMYNFIPLNPHIFPVAAKGRLNVSQITLERVVDNTCMNTLVSLTNR